jgi:hypothetical protein
MVLAHALIRGEMGTVTKRTDSKFGLLLVARISVSIPEIPRINPWLK